VEQAGSTVMTRAPPRRPIAQHETAMMRIYHLFGDGEPKPRAAGGAVA